LISIAFLFEGTAEIALQNITNLSDYNQEKKKWESVAKFSVEQVSSPLNSHCMYLLLTEPQILMQWL